jgi:hypothetical protein
MTYGIEQKNCRHITNKLAACHNDKIDQHYKIMSQMEIAVVEKAGMQNFASKRKKEDIS